MNFVLAHDLLLIEIVDGMVGLVHIASVSTKSQREGTSDWTKGAGLVLYSGRNGWNRENW